MRKLRKHWSDHKGTPSVYRNERWRCLLCGATWHRRFLCLCIRIPRDNMPDHPITLTADETRLVLALKPNTTMTLTRAFDPQPPKGTQEIGMSDCQGYYRDFPLETRDWPSPLGKPGDVLAVDDVVRVSLLGLLGAETSIHARLAVVSVTPRLDGETWVVDATVTKTKE